jgi:hypothetical protein
MADQKSLKDELKTHISSGPPGVNDFFYKHYISKNKCQRGIVGLYGVLFLLLLIMTGTVIQEGRSGNKGISWALFVFSLFLGVIAVIVIVKAKNNKKIYIPLLSIVIATMNMTAMIMAQPKLSTRELVTPHFANILFVIVAVASAVYAG